MKSSFNTNRMSWFLFNRYHSFDPLITFNDVSVWVQVYEFLYYERNPSTSIIDYVWKRTLDELRKEFNFKYTLFIIDQDILKEQSICYENYLLEKINFNGNEFDHKKYFLGQICGNRHEYKTTGKSLRYRKNGECIACCVSSKTKRHCINALFDIKVNENIKIDRLSKRNEININKQYKDEIDFDTTKYRLGTICKNNHIWKNSVHSLRYKSDNNCIICQKMKNK